MSSRGGQGSKALDTVALGQGANLIVLDLRMPVMNGWRFRALQKADPLLVNIPVLGHLGGRERERRRR